MTVIAWDGKRLAADKRAMYGEQVNVVTKIRRLADGRLVGASGDFALAQEMLRWLEQGGPFPERQLKRDLYVPTIEIRKDGACWMYEDGPVPFRIESLPVTIGSGREFALMALHLGKDATEAVRLTCELTHTCGNGVDTLELIP